MKETITLKKSGLEMVRNRAVTLKDICRKTGYAVSTISSVLNNDVSCFASQKVKEEILKTAKEFGYHPNLLYRGLKKQKTNVIGLIVPSLRTHITRSITELIGSFAEKAGYHIFIGYSHNDVAKEEMLLRDFVSHRVDGIILIIAEEGKNRQELQYILNQNLPFVTIGKLKSFPFSFVSTDYYLGGQLAASHLAELGHKKVGIIYLSASETISQRIAGFKDTAYRYMMKVEEIPLQKNKRRISKEEFEEEKLIQETCEYAKKVLHKKDRPTAIFAGNDEIAVGVIKTAIESGIKVPDDLSVMGFDDSLSAIFSPVPLTTIRQKRHEVSEMAVKILLNKINTGTEEQVEKWIPTELIIRSSTAKVKMD
ncbi:MAG: LacI family transcriptional regulator [Candidatus Omnitrophica bacterium]|nr:LacI family transcriptional regulator [Candidatus Omnitrophota bacterium]